MSSEGGPEPPPPGGEPASVENYTDLLAHLLAEVRQINQLGQLQAAALRRTADRISTMEGRLQSLEHANSAALTQTALELNTLSALRETGRHAGLTIGALDVPEADLLAAAMMPPPPVPAAPHAAAPVASSDGAGPSAPPPRGEPGGVSQGVIHMVRRPLVHALPRRPSPSCWRGAEGSTTRRGFRTQHAESRAPAASPRRPSPFPPFPSGPGLAIRLYTARLAHRRHRASRRPLVQEGAERRRPAARGGARTLPREGAAGGVVARAAGPCSRAKGDGSSRRGGGGGGGAAAGRDFREERAGAPRLLAAWAP